MKPGSAFRDSRRGESDWRSRADTKEARMVSPVDPVQSSPVRRERRRGSSCANSFRRGRGGSSFFLVRRDTHARGSTPAKMGSRVGRLDRVSYI